MKRIQRKRTKGWKMPDNTFYVGRPTKWGNPFKLVGDIIYIDAGYRRKTLDRWVFFETGNIHRIIHLYWSMVTKRNIKGDSDIIHWKDRFKELDLSELQGKDLACFCPLDKPCHADVLIELCQKEEL